MRSIAWFGVVGSWALIGCGDDAAGAEPCPMTLMAGQTQACNCDDSTVGAQMCGTDGLLTECMCGPGTPMAMGGTAATMTGGTGGGVGGTSATSGGAGGAGPIKPPVMMDEDAGMPMGGSGGAGGAGGTGGGTMAPMDGNQNAYCESGLDCNKGFDCYLPTGTGAGYCTIPCMGDMACDAVAGADYTCSPEGLCRVVCMGMDDTMSCPDGMECTTAGGFPGGAGRCNWPEGGVPAGSAPAYGECTSNAACADGLRCALPATSPFPGSGGPGYCTKECMTNMDCPAAPATSDIPATCEPVQLGSMMGVCALDCYGAPEGCPDGMMCQPLSAGVFRRCGY